MKDEKKPYRYKLTELANQLDEPQLSKDIKYYAKLADTRIHELEYELSELKRDYNSERRHYAVIEKSNESYVKIIDQHILNGDNLNFKKILTDVVSLLESDRAIQALEIGKKALEKPNENH